MQSRHGVRLDFYIQSLAKIEFSCSHFLTAALFSNEGNKKTCFPCDLCDSGLDHQNFLG